MKTAVILSARQDKDTKIPYPLKPYYKDWCLMDRTMEALTALGYSNIIIVGGMILSCTKSMLLILLD